MKFYIASGLRNWRQVRDISDALEESGWHNACNWAAHEPAGNESLTGGRLAEISRDELRAIIDSDVVIVLLTAAGAGTYAELGASAALCELGQSKKIYLYSEDPAVFDVSGKTHAIYHNAHVIQKTGDIAEVMRDILEENR